MLFIEKVFMVQPVCNPIGHYALIVTDNIFYVQEQNQLPFIIAFSIIKQAHSCFSGGILCLGMRF